MLRIATLSRPPENVVQGTLLEILRKETAALRERLLLGAPGSQDRKKL